MFRPPPPPAGGLPSPFISQREGSCYRERDRWDRVASPLRVGPNGPVDDDGGAPVPCPGETCTVRPNRMGGVGSSSRRTGDVRLAEMGGASPWRVLRLDPQPGGRLGRAVVACLLRGSSRRTPLPTLMPEVCPLAWLVALWGPQGPHGLRRTCSTPFPWVWAQCRARRTRPIPDPWGRTRRACPPPLLRVGLSMPLLLVGRSVIV
jgi:hypothetical protein